MADPIFSPLRLALVGMSGTGKTFWSKRLAATGRVAFCCDDSIEQRLRSRLDEAAVHAIRRRSLLRDKKTFQI